MGTASALPTGQRRPAVGSRLKGGRSDACSKVMRRYREEADGFNENALYGVL
ncbi:hypothetical protein ABZ725_50555 [Streptomyces sp. NPDC006872]|uniref:hypothetical protein n=1 Tax=Streptomyces sp. NPDC006872 TaxID=3155720 RepID=UPI0033EAA796